MRTKEINTTIVDGYAELLDNLSTDTKLVSCQYKIVG